LHSLAAAADQSVLVRRLKITLFLFTNMRSQCAYLIFTVALEMRMLLSQISISLSSAGSAKMRVLGSRDTI
jgi:hypothetical protein